MAGAILFYGRFYMQWLASELRGRSVVPMAFWYMSAVGSVLLLLYGVFYLRSPVGALSHCFNTVIYARNLVHIWRNKGVLSGRRALLFQAGVAVWVSVGTLLVAYTWLREYQSTQDSGFHVQAQIWFWIAVGVLGQGLFALRFLVQWFITELRKQSVIPPVFWYLSILASILLISSHAQRQEWLYAIGIGTTLLVYVRNAWLVYRTGTASFSE